MDQLVDAALPLWGLENAKYELIAARENRVFRVSGHGKDYALRLHRVGYRTDAELAAELDWMAALSRAGLSFPSPVASRAGEYLQTVDGVQVDVLGWLNGNTLDELLGDLSSTQKERCFFQLGRALAKLHTACDDWGPPKNFSRLHWDTDGLVGETPLWDRFWDNPELSVAERELSLEFKNTAQAQLKSIGRSLDYGLIHADLVPANVMFDDQNIHLIDFDDGGFGYRIFDIATALLKLQNDPDYSAIQRNLIDGYLSKRHLDMAHLDLFFCLRAATYVGWNILRMKETGGAERNRRFINTFTTLARAYLD